MAGDRRLLSALIGAYDRGKEDRAYVYTFKAILMSGGGGTSRTDWKSAGGDSVFILL